jgi:hypothetical protein
MADDNEQERLAAYHMTTAHVGDYLKKSLTVAHVSEVLNTPPPEQPSQQSGEQQPGGSERQNTEDK